ncbi:MAG: zinc ribbon domain-containing protein [Anaerolineales bacterium]|nr:zinc ribbon domain-containing protein [Anaerolineales bacterium]MCX7755231.1 zinc ribbon domain-containing protein [Anaerolineales bacterium]MDW8277504.1 zinc ribbon domain-containing protein [Anaerolineales bacterium]
MPTYDYICHNCHKRFDVFMTYQEYGTRPVTCPHCSSGNVARRVPRVRVLKGEEARLEAFSDPAKFAGLEDDPRAMGRMFREMGSALGEEMPPQFDEIVERLEAGQSPEEIEKTMPDWGEGLGTQEFGGHSHEDHTHSHED